LASSPQPFLTIGARASRLSLAQAGQVQRRIARALGHAEADAARIAPILAIATTGDRIQDRRLAEVGGKGLFTREIEEALLAGRIDCAVHSLKDMPAELPAGLCIAAVPEREDPRDAFLSPRAATLAGLPAGASLGVAGLRRQAQALGQRPDLEIVLLRGNVDTRLAKLDRGEADAIILALAGLKRLGLAHRATSLIDPLAQPPAPGQGALAIETRQDDRDAAWAVALRHAPSQIAVAAERAALAALEGSCKSAIGAYARLQGTRLSLVVEALAPDGAHRFRREAAGEAADEAAARALGARLGEAVRADAGAALEP